MSVEADRLSSEWAMDDEVLESLALNGDLPTVVRPVDVSFYGEREKLKALAVAMAKEGFELDYWSERDDGQPWIFLRRDQRSDRETIYATTRVCLEAEVNFGVTHDGWGCLAHNENGPIDNENPA